jgi:hypothetical protein
MRFFPVSEDGNKARTSSGSLSTSMGWYVSAPYALMLKTKCEGVRFAHSSALRCAGGE